MKTREKIEVGIIIGLAVALIQIIAFSQIGILPIGIESARATIQNPPSDEGNLRNESSFQSAETIKTTSDFIENYSILTEIYNRVENSVVQISHKESLTNSHIIINGNPLEEQTTQFGSGFIFDKQGHIITNAHVISNAETVDVLFVNGNAYTAKVIGTDPHADIAVLKIVDNISADDLIPIPIGDSSSVEVGQPTIAIGNPFGLSNTMTTGIISQTGRILPNPELGFSIPNVIQTDAAINPGNSGGPLLNLEGQVIGINTAIQSRIGEFSGIGFAIPSQILKKIIPDLIEKGSYDHPWLGISGASLNKKLVEDLDLPKNYHGVVISEVINEGPASKAGLKEAMYNANGEIKSADVIIAVDGIAVKRIDDIISYIFENKNVGDNLHVTLNREGKMLNYDVILQKRPS